MCVWVYGLGLTRIGADTVCNTHTHKHTNVHTYIGYIPGARLEPYEGHAGHGQSASNRTGVSLFVCMCVCACVCLFMQENDMQDMDRAHRIGQVCLYLCVCVCVCVCLCRRKTCRIWTELTE
jgi:hypothetical protein